MEVLKPFNLKLAKEGAEVKTGKGERARIVCWDVKGGGLLALVEDIEDGCEHPLFFNEDGTCNGLCNIDEKYNLKIVAKVPDRWRDNENARKHGWFIDIESKIIAYDASNIDINRNLFADQKQAQSALAMAQISQILANDKRYGGVITDEEWENGDTQKYVIAREFGTFNLQIINSIWYFLAFHTAAQRDLFLKENEDLVEQYLMI